MSDVAGNGASYAAFAVGTNQQGATGQRGRLVGVVLNPGSTISTVKVYDGQTATGTPMASLTSPASGASLVLKFENLYPHYNNGFTVVVAGTSADATIYYKDE